MTKNRFTKKGFFSRTKLGSSKVVRKLEWDGQRVKKDFALDCRAVSGLLVHVGLS